MRDKLGGGLAAAALAVRLNETGWIEEADQNSSGQAAACPPSSPFLFEGRFREMIT
jgi:hypothetical protein